MTLREACLLLVLAPGCALPAYDYDPPPDGVGTGGSGNAATGGAGNTGGAGADNTGGSGNAATGGTGNAGGGGAGGTSTGPPSCDPAKNASHDACPGGDCCESPAVEGGMFSRYYSMWQPHADPQWFATVADFRLDRFEVTVSRFRAFVEEYAVLSPGDGEHPLIPGSGWPAELTPTLPSTRADLIDDLSCGGDASFTPQPDAFELHPINCVSWPVAFAFCAWDGGWLPTEAEWNYAAVAGAQHRRYPWADDPPPGNDFTGLAVTCTGFDMGNCLNPGTLSPVGTVPNGAGLYLQEDLSGNVEEWTLDYYHEPLPMPCINCAQLEPSENLGGSFFSNRSRHGGSYASSQGNLRAPERQNSTPSSRSEERGLRCARPL